MMLYDALCASSCSNATNFVMAKPATNFVMAKPDKPEGSFFRQEHPRLAGFELPSKVLRFLAIPCQIKNSVSYWHPDIAIDIDMASTSCKDSSELGN